MNNTLLVCGTRHGASETLIEECLRDALKAGYVNLVHGGATGVDTQAGDIGLRLGFDVVRCPAKWELFGKVAGPIRNAAMLHLYEPSIVLAFPGKVSVGTRGMIDLCRRAGVVVTVHEVEEPTF